MRWIRPFLLWLGLPFFEDAERISGAGDVETLRGPGIEGNG